LKETTLENGNTLLHDAIQNQKYDIIMYLIDKGVEINVKNNEGNTPLHFACMTNNSDGCKQSVIQVLIDNNADYTVKNGNNTLALDLILEEEIKKQISNEIKLLQGKTRDITSRMKN